jgi:hypothetical protein
MSRGKYLSLEEARKTGNLDDFAKTHPSEADRDRFTRLLEAMSQGVLEAKETSVRGRAACSTGTRTRQGT